MSLPQPLLPIRGRRMAESVIERLIALIQQGQLGPGARLPAERDLARELGVSRAVVREAILYLQQAGLVRTRQGSGTYVADAGGSVGPAAPPAETQQDLVWLFELRMGIEGEAAALAARRATPEDRRRLAAALDRLERDVAAGRLGVEADFDLHAAVAAASGNPHLARALAAATDLLLRSVTVSRARSMAVPGRPQLVVEEHRAICHRIAAGDPDGARKAMRDHLQAALMRLAGSGGEPGDDTRRA